VFAKDSKPNAGPVLFVILFVKTRRQRSIVRNALGDVTISMHLFSLYALGLACLANAAALVPGKAFDRFITIWLENRVS
jgi:hypothetical protein